MSAGLVVTRFKRNSRLMPYGTRLHREDCRTLREDTARNPFTPDQRIDRRCKVCKPEVTR